MKLSTFNARSEEAASKPTFRDALKHGRCLVPVLGYYEWMGPKGSKTPFFISVETNAQGFCIAGICAYAQLHDFEGRTYTILTRAPDAPIAHIHNRMPVILDPESYDALLDGADVDEVGRVAHERLRFHEVGSAVGNVKNDSSELMEAA